jgi:hypothetical protein
MIYADRNGNRTEKTTGQDRFLEYIYGHTLTRIKAGINGIFASNASDRLWYSPVSANLGDPQ